MSGSRDEPVTSQGGPIIRPRTDPPDRRDADTRRPLRPRSARRPPCPGATSDGTAGAPEPASTGGGDLRTQVLLFAHLAQVSLTLSSLPARRRDEVQRDLAVLRTESDRGVVRPAVVDVLVGSVVAVLTPELPAGVARSLAEARPVHGVDDRIEEQDASADTGPACLT